MAENKVEPKLSDVFNDLWNIYECVDSTDDPVGSEGVQTNVKKAIELCDKAIHMVNELSLFSSNENIEEVATVDIRYILLPALLGFFTAKNTKEERYEILKKEQVCFIEYLKLAKMYGITQVNIPKIKQEEEESSGDSRVSSGRPDLAVMASQRQSKIERYRQQKETDTKLKELYKAVQKETVDDEVKRDYYLTLLKKWVNTTLDELDAIDMELPIVRHMAKLKESGASGAPSPSKPEKKANTGFRPFILTKDKLQAQVFGAGYPSLPTYSVEEWYEQQVAAGKLPDPSQSQSLLQQAMNGPQSQAQHKEEEEAEKEKKIEEDDEETLQKARNWDDWKDDHRRGWGNRQNMG